MRYEYGIGIGSNEPLGMIDGAMAEEMPWSIVPKGKMGA